MLLDRNPNIAIAGSVNSSLLTLQKLIFYEMNLKVVLALNPEKASNVSGYNDLKIEADKHKIPSIYFNNINDDNVSETLKDNKIDIFFVIGLSQLVKKHILDIAKFGNVGFHPTKLPEGRGRGTLAWIILGKAKGAATFFIMDESMDSGPIIGQKVFDVSTFDYPSDVIEKIKISISGILDDILPELKTGIINSVEQDQSKITFLGQRKPKDGLIIWTQSAEDIYDLVRATSTPLPGAFFMLENNVIKVFRSKIHNNYCGVPGRVIDIIDNNPVIACGKGAIELSDYNKNFKFKVGTDIN